MSKRWIPGALLCGWMGLTTAVRAQAPLPTGPTTPPAPAAPASPAPATTELAQLPDTGEGTPDVADPTAPGAYGAYPWGTVMDVPPPGPVAPQMPFIPQSPSDGIAITAFEPEATCPSPDTWCTVKFDYLLYWTKNRGLPLLVTSGFTTDPIPGAVGQPTTSQLIGGALNSLTDGSSARSRSFDANNHNGYKITLGAWLDGAQTLQLEANFFQLFERTASRLVDTTALNSTRQVFPVALARPFYNFTLFREDAVVVGAPPGTFASINTSISRSLYGGEANLRCFTPYSTFSLGRCALTFGGRYLSMDADLEISQLAEGTAGLPGFRPRTTLNEQLKGTTNFYGGQMGFEYELRYGGFVFDFNSKVALGANSEKLTLGSTSTSVDAFGNPTASSVNNGVIVRPSNAGSFSRTEFSYVAEAGINLGYEFNEWVRINVGYSLLYWDKVIEPEDQIDRAVNAGATAAPSSTNPNPRPTVRLKADDFYMQGLSAGLQFSW